MGVLIPPRLSVRLNPADPYERLDHLRRMAAANSGASDNERQTALRLIARMEAELRAAGKPTTRYTPPPPPRAQSSSASWYQDVAPPAPTFVAIPPAYAPLVAKDLLPRDQGGKNYYVSSKASYQFVKARYTGDLSWLPRTPYFDYEPVDGFLLLGVPNLTSEYKPVLLGFYANFFGSPASGGQIRTRDLELGEKGLYHDGRLLFAIDPADVKVLQRIGAWYQLM
jgi:hypothetical protein